jgi:predicted flavoprotein YhiN
MTYPKMIYREYPFTINEYHYQKRKKSFCTLTGDFLFTHKGLSGPVILAISRYAEKGDMILLSFLGIQ